MESEDQLAQREEPYVLQRLREVGLDLRSLNEVRGLSLSSEQARFLEKLLRKEKGLEVSRRGREAAAGLRMGLAVCTQVREETARKMGGRTSKYKHPFFMAQVRAS